LSPEGSGRAVTPDCPRIVRGSSETVERYDYELELQVDHLLAVFGEALAD
jgi:hypothetical protein